MNVAIIHAQILVLQLERVERRSCDHRDTRVLCLARELLAALQTRMEQEATDAKP